MPQPCDNYSEGPEEKRKCGILQEMYFLVYINVNTYITNYNYLLVNLAPSLDYGQGQILFIFASSLPRIVPGT